jgi:DNA processing protein
VTETVAIVALSRLKGMERGLKRKAIEEYDNVSGLFEGRGERTDRALVRACTAFKDQAAIEAEITRLARMGAQVVTIRDPHYPPLLRHIPDAPLVLFQKGPLEAPENAIAIVGSRKATLEGMHLAEKMSATLSSAGITVVSGLARGIDAAAHRGAAGERGKTVAVLGCGLDICYPAENRSLFRRIGEEGALLTEYGLGERPLRHHFPERNRIIAGMVKGVLVVEASTRSGSLITARLGLEYGREVMAVPGNIFVDPHRGTNTLIKEGAKLIDCAEEIIESAFPGLKPAPEKRIDMDAEERYIYGFLGHERTHVEDLIERSSRKAQEVMAILTRLQLKDAAAELPGGFYVRK